jgi:hypothetical protein
MPIKVQISTVRQHTYFLSGIKPVNLAILESRLLAGDPKVVWSSIFDDHDAMMFSVIVALLGNVVPWGLIKRIRLSIVSNLIQNRDKFLVKRKEYLAKKRRFVLSHTGTDPEIPRNLTWMKEVYDLIKDPVDSRGYAEKYLCLLNKRSCGVPRDPSYIEEKLKEYFYSVSQHERDDEPDIPSLEKAAWEVQRYMIPKGLSAAATILVTTSACFERSVGKGGKLSLLREIALSEDNVFKYDLETGVKTQEVCQRFADKVLHHCLDKAQSGYPDLYKTRVCALPELGMKVRIPTCSSFYRSQILQPISKIFLEALKGLPPLAAGLSRERPGWEVYKSLHSFPDPQVRVLCSDYKSSTDWIKRSVSRRAFSLLSRIVGLPTWYSRIACEMYHADLYHTPSQGRTSNAGKEAGFRPESVLNSTHRISSGVAMGDPITKAILSFLSIAVGYGSRRPGEPFWAVGDDFAAIWSRPDDGRFRQIVGDIGFKISEEDTFLSPHWGHFTEFAFRIPRNRYEVYRICKVVRHHPCYADALRPRIVMRTGKAGANESDPRVGRLKLLAQEASYLPQDEVHPSQFRLDIATVWQDIEFGVRSATPYLPTIFGGMGKTLPPGYLNSLPLTKEVQLLKLAADYTRFPASSRRYHPAREFLRARVQLNTQLYNSHMGESKYVNLTAIINMIEQRVDLNKFLVISAGEQAKIGVNLSRVLTHENHYVVTSEQIATRLYAFSSFMEEIFDVRVLSAPVLDVEPQIPDEVWGFRFPDNDGRPNYRALAEEFHPFRSIYLKEVMSLLETTDLIRPEIKLSVDVDAGFIPPTETDLSKFARYVALLHKNTDSVDAWMNIPRKVIDDDAIIKHIARLTEALTGERPVVVTNDRALRREVGSYEPAISRAEMVEKLVTVISKGESALRALVDEFAGRENIPSRHLRIEDTANVDALALSQWDGIKLPQDYQDEILVYLKGNFPPFREPPMGMRPKTAADKVAASNAYFNALFDITFAE